MHEDGGVPELQEPCIAGYYDRPFHSMSICEAAAIEASRLPVPCWHVYVLIHICIYIYIYMYIK